MPHPPDALGKRSLFWAPAERYEEGPRNSEECDVPGKYALFSEAAPATDHAGPAEGEIPSPPGAGMFASVTLDCSSCRTRSRVDLVEFIALHLPVWFWRPGRGYTRYMACPSCRRRTWISASWVPRSP